MGKVIHAQLQWGNAPDMGQVRYYAAPAATAVSLHCDAPSFVHGVLTPAGWS